MQPLTNDRLHFAAEEAPEGLTVGELGGIIEAGPWCFRRLSILHRRHLDGEDHLVLVGAESLSRKFAACQLLALQGKLIAQSLGSVQFVLAVGYLFGGILLQSDPNLVVVLVVGGRLLAQHGLQVLVETEIDISTFLLLA